MVDLQEWLPSLGTSGKSIYLEIADAIERDVRAGVLQAGDRLPTQRSLSARLEVDYTTVSRAYAAASRRGLIESFVGRGTFVNGSAPQGSKAKRSVQADLRLNPPPDVSEPELLARMAMDLQSISADLMQLLRYQSAIGSDHDRATAARWLARRGLDPQPDSLLITPGSHAAVAIVMSVLATAGDCIACEELTDPSFRSIAARMGLKLVGVASDEHGMLPDALEAAIQASAPRALYLNPVLHNPTTRTIPKWRKEELSAVLLRHSLPVIEDDAYGLIVPSSPPPFTTTAPELTWHISSLSRYLGAGLRLAYVLAPNGRMALSAGGALRAFNVMPSPITAALATTWIESGTAGSVLSFIRDETRRRQSIAAEVLAGHAFESNPYSFSIWLKLPPGIGRAELMGRMSGCRIGMMPSDAFTLSDTPSEHVRVGLGGPATRDDIRSDLALLDEMLTLGNWAG